MKFCSAKIDSLSDIDSFDSAKFRNKPVLVFVYMTGCPYCEVMKPEWNRFTAAHEINTIEANFMLLDTLKKFYHQPFENINPNGYPHIQLVKHDSKRVVQYNGQRIKEEFSNFVNKHVEKLPPTPKPDKKKTTKKTTATKTKKSEKEKSEKKKPTTKKPPSKKTLKK